MKTIFHHFFLVGLTFCYIGLAILGYWWIYPYQSIQFKKNPLPLVNHNLKVGDKIPIEFDFCKLDDTNAHILISIEDHVFYELAPVNTATQKGCYDRISNMIIVPDALHVGDHARVHFHFQYQVNPIRMIEYDFYTEEFTIIK